MLADGTGGFAPPVMIPVGPRPWLLGAHHLPGRRSRRPVADASLIPLTRGLHQVTGVSLVDWTVPDPNATRMTDASAVPATGNGSPLFYQIVAVCGDGLTEGPI